MVFLLPVAFPEPESDDILASGNHRPCVMKRLRVYLSIAGKIVPEEQCASFWSLDVPDKRKFGFSALVYIIHVSHRGPSSLPSLRAIEFVIITPGSKPVAMRLEFLSGKIALGLKRLCS